MDETRFRIYVDVSQDVRRKLKVKAVQEDTSVRELVAQALRLAYPEVYEQN